MLADLLARLGPPGKQRPWLAELSFWLDGAHGRPALDPVRAEQVVVDYAAKAGDPPNFGHFKAFLATGARGHRPPAGRPPAPLTGGPRAARGTIVG